MKRQLRPFTVEVRKARTRAAMPASASTSQFKTATSVVTPALELSRSGRVLPSLLKTTSNIAEDPGVGQTAVTKETAHAEAGADASGTGGPGAGHSAYLGGSATTYRYRRSDCPEFGATRNATVQATAGRALEGAKASAFVLEVSSGSGQCRIERRVLMDKLASFQFAGSSESKSARQSKVSSQQMIGEPVQLLTRCTPKL
jgi:hypothetical protein